MKRCLVAAALLPVNCVCDPKSDGPDAGTGTGTDTVSTTDVDTADDSGGGEWTEGEGRWDLGSYDVPPYPPTLPPECESLSLPGTDVRGETSGGPFASTRAIWALWGCGPVMWLYSDVPDFDFADLEAGYWFHGVGEIRVFRGATIHDSRSQIETTEEPQDSGGPWVGELTTFEEGWTLAGPFNAAHCPELDMPIPCE